MENKKTTELLDLLLKSQEKMDSGKDDGDEFGEIFGELRNREPFRSIIGNGEFDESLEQRIAELEDSIKLLKRHKHDEKSGDVMVRI